LRGSTAEESTIIAVLNPRIQVRKRCVVLMSASVLSHAAASSVSDHQRIRGRLPRKAFFRPITLPQSIKKAMLAAASSSERVC
jgi:hypothetical protein